MVPTSNLAFLLTCLLSLVAGSPSQKDPLEVHLTSGNFLGVATANGTDRWLGIPFAQPPVGSLRFKAPLAITRPQNGVQDAFGFGNACPQVPSSSLGAPMSEDCLFLNVRDRLAFSRLS